MVNSTWTQGHINRLLRPFGWRDDADEEEVAIEPFVVTEDVSGGLRYRGAAAEKQVSGEDVVSGEKRFKVAKIVYPPCDTLSLAALPLEMRENLILSVAQFRCVRSSLLTRTKLISPQT